jgi:phenylacetate-CoA ligase
MRCPMGFYHLNQESMVVEIESQGGEGFKEGAGEILVTPLDPSPMPFIRYRIGDIGKMPTGRCSCGRSLQLFSEVLGRSGELYQLKNGRMLSPNFWSHIFRDDELVYDVKRFQVVYQSEDLIRILIVPNDGFTPQSEAHLRQRLRNLLGPEIHVAVEQALAIRPLPSGKYQVVVNESSA